MPKYTIYAADGKTPVLEFDSEKANPHFYDMLRKGGDVLRELNDINKGLPTHAPNLIRSYFLFLRYLKHLNTSETDVQKAYSKNIKLVLSDMKDFIINPKLSVTHNCFSAQFHSHALSQTQLLVDDIERTYDRILNRCMAMRADLLARLSIGLAILSVILGVLGAATLFR